MALRHFDGFIVAAAQTPGMDYEAFAEPASEKLAWLLLRQLTDIPQKGMSGIPGTLRERRRAFQEFRNYVRQGITYWEAASNVKGSAAALPYYYSVLNFAKAELVRYEPSLVIGQRLNHGLSFQPTSSPSIAADHLRVTANGVFPLLYKKRTGLDLASGTRLPIRNLLSLIPEIGIEVEEIGRNRPSSFGGFMAIVSNANEAWTLIATYAGAFSDVREPTTRKFLRRYEPVHASEFSNWREVLALSKRVRGDAFDLFQSKRTHAREKDGSTIPDMYGAATDLAEVVGPYLSMPINREGEFVLTPSLRKTSPMPMPLDLARYASMYYLSSVVRYKPGVLDPTSQGAQAWLMDSFVEEVPADLLSNHVMGIRGASIFYNTAAVRV